MTEVRVGIVSWNCAAALRRCLAALPDALGALEAEVVVVDNASSDASASVAEEAGVHVIRAERNLGYARAMNRALSGSGAPALIALNPDTVPRPGSLAVLVAVLRSGPGVGLASPRLLREDGRPETSTHRFPTLPVAAVANLFPWRLLTRRIRNRFTLPGPGHDTRSGPVDWATGAVHCIRSEALAGAVPYRERWFMYVEDLDLCWRLRQAGWDVVYVTDAEVVHVGNVSGRQAFAGLRTARWWNETYDWYGLTFGGGRTRLYALLNLVGWLRSCAGLIVGSFSPDASRHVSRRRLRARWPEAQVSLRTVLLGPTSPLPPPTPRQGSGPDRTASS